MEFKLVLLFILTFGVGPGLFVYGVVLALRYNRLRKHGKRAAADVERVTAYSRGADVCLTWMDDDGDKRKETIRVSSGLFGTEIGKKMEILYDDNHAVAANRKPYVSYLVAGTIGIALGTLAVFMLSHF